MHRMQSSRAVGPRRAFWLALAVLVGMLVVLCACETVQGDVWGHVLRARRDGPLTLARFAQLAHDEYLYNNPRWGQLALILACELRALHLVLTPLAIATVLLASAGLAVARWPRPSRPGDAWLLVQATALALVTTPQLGAIWLYRPTCCNYVYPLAVQLAWLMPYRSLAARPYGFRHATLVMLAGGALAGAGNEHTGIALVLAAVAACVLAYRRDRRVPAWAVAGVSGCIAGYGYLLTAPGQHERYRGLADQLPLGERVVANLVLPAELLAWLAPAAILVACAAPALRRCRRAVWCEAAVFGAIACVALATALASPKQVARLLLAPSALFAIGLGVVLVEASQLPAVARRVRVAASGIIALYAATLLVVQGVTRIEGERRVARLLAAPPGTAACVPPLTFSAPTPFSLGDDLRSARLRARVAAALGLTALERRAERQHGAAGGRCDADARDPADAGVVLP